MTTSYIVEIRESSIDDREITTTENCFHNTHEAVKNWMNCLKNNINFFVENSNGNTHKEFLSFMLNKKSIFNNGKQIEYELINTGLVLIGTNSSTRKIEIRITQIP